MDNRTGSHQVYTARVVFPTTSVNGNAGVASPSTYELSANYPNPFNPMTTVWYQLAVVSDVRLDVHDLLGREVAVLVNEKQSPGNYEVRFDAAALASGIYIYRLTAGSFVQTRKMLVIK